jgi:hypothetical protein
LVRWVRVRVRVRVRARVKGLGLKLGLRAGSKKRKAKNGCFNQNGLSGTRSYSNQPKSKTK